MTTTCKQLGLHAYASDPTHTLSLRNAFARQMGKRFNQLQKDVKAAIIDDDCFGLNDGTGLRRLKFNIGHGPGYRAFAFPTSQAKADAFMKWFKKQADAGILEVSQVSQLGGALDKGWTDTYVKQSYERGVMRGRKEMLDAGYDVPPLGASGGIWGAFNTPMHLDRVGILYSRTFTGLKGITAAMDAQVSQVLSMGLVDGLGTRELSRQLYRTIGSGLGITDKIGRFIPAKRRAKMLARTEVIRAHHQATIQEYENWRVEGVYVKAELVTGADPCPECSALEGIPFKLEEIRNMIPVHPSCKCCTIPIDMTKTTKGKKAVAPKEEIMQPFSKVTAKQVNDWEANDQSFAKFLGAKRVGMDDTPAALKKMAASRLDARIAASPKADKEAFEYFVQRFGLEPYKDSYSARLINSWAGTSADSSKLALYLQRAAAEEFGLSKASIRHFSEDAIKELEHFLASMPQKEKVMKGARVWLRKMYNETQFQLKSAGIDNIAGFRGASFSKSEMTSKMKSALAKRKVKLKKAIKVEKAKVDELLKSKYVKQGVFDSPLERERAMAWKVELDSAKAKATRTHNQLKNFDKGSASAAIEEEMALQPLSSFSTSLDTANGFAGNAEDALSELFSQEVVSSEIFSSISVSNIPRERILSMPSSGFGCLSETEVVVLGGVDDVSFAFTAGNHEVTILEQWIDAFLETLG